MAQQSPLLVKHPAQAAASVVPPANGSAAGGSQFIPRKEFIRDNRIISSFSLLTFAGSSLVRLYSFSNNVLIALRQHFGEHGIPFNVRESAEKGYFEYVLQDKYWGGAKDSKSAKTEKLIIDILQVLFVHGYTFLSTIEYGRDPDDRVAIAFSRPTLASSSTLPPTFGSASALVPTNTSVISLAHPVRTSFALSFPSATLLRVVGAPLHLTPAILQAVRGAWPRGVDSEKRVADGTYEFTLKGNKVFQENTFANDSLSHIFALLSSLDTHGFTLLSSLSLRKPSRFKDLWIFSGPLDDQPNTHDSALSTPNASSLELRREVTPQGHAGNAVGAHSTEKLVQAGPNGLYRQISPIKGLVGATTGGQPHHARGLSGTIPVTSSPLKPPGASQSKAPFALLRKQAPKTQIPVAFRTENVEDSPHPSTSNELSQDPAYSPSVGSVDMTGVGAGRRSTDTETQTPDVFYTTNGRQNGVSPFSQSTPFQNGVKTPSEPPHAAFAFPGRDRRASDSQHRSLMPPEASRLRGGSPEHRPPFKSPPRLDMQSSRARRASTPPALSQIYAPSPIVPPDQDHLLGDGSFSSQVSRNGKGSPKEPLIDTPRTPTPPLLNAGIFRDSAFSGSTDCRSCEIPIGWAGRESGSRYADSIREEGQHDRSHPPQSRAEHDRTGAGTGSAARVGSGRDEKDDVAYTLPSPIQEHPSQEQDDVETEFLPRTADMNADIREAKVKGLSPEPVQPHGLGARKSEAASVGLYLGQSKKSSPATTPPAGKAKDSQRVSDSSRSLDMSGWVMVNVEGHGSSKDKGKEGAVAGALRGHGKSSSQTVGAKPTNGRPAHTRSISDSRALNGKSPGTEAGPAQSSMSPAAKTIAIIDAVGAKEREQEKANSRSGFRKLFAKARGSNDSGTASKRRTPEGETGRLKRMGVPVATRATDKRQSIN